MELDIANDSARDDEHAIDSEPDRFSESHKEVFGKTPKATHVSLRDHDLPHQQARWARLSKYYNDRYLDFFIKDSQAEEDTDTALKTSQYGSIIWTGLEKEVLFRALSTKGRHNLSDIAAAVKTKSVVEIRDYLNRLKIADAEHQMFAPHVKNVTLAEVDAAVEIHEDLEEKLERTADALAAFQDKYDLTKAKGDEEIWMINTAIAETVDQENESHETSQLDQPGQKFTSNGERNKVLGFFQFGTMLQLSRSLFMNPADESEHDHWTAYAEEDEEPSLTVDAAREYYDLVKSFTQRVLQTATFLAQSRIRSATRSDYAPRGILKDIDVEAALNVLNLPVDPWDYWTTFARRSGVKVVLGHHKKGQNSSLTLEQVETTLSVRSSRGRRRSLSSIVSQSSQEDEATSDDEPESENGGTSVYQSVEQENHQDMSASSGPEDSLSSASASESSKETETVEEASIGNYSTANDTEGHVSRKRRRTMVEEAQDEHLERLDRAAQLRAEHHLQELVTSDVIKEEPEVDVPGRPRGQRKNKEDLKDWSETVYYSPWEVKKLLEENSGGLSPADSAQREDN